MNGAPLPAPPIMSGAPPPRSQRSYDGAPIRRPSSSADDRLSEHLSSPASSALASRVDSLERKIAELENRQGTDLNMRMEIMDLKTNVNKKVEEEVERRLRVQKREMELKINSLETQIQNLTKAITPNN